MDNIREKVEKIYREMSGTSDMNKEDEMDTILKETSEKIAGSRKCLKFSDDIDGDNFQIEDGIVYVNHGCDPIKTLTGIIEKLVK